ncbi:MAG: SH3 domain-containing protein [Mangrovibacterium sp.]
MHIFVAYPQPKPASNYTVPVFNIKYTKAYLNVREKPDNKSKIITTLNPNQKVTTNGIVKNGFSQVVGSGDQSFNGWCASNYLLDNPLIKEKFEKVQEEHQQNKSDYIIIAKEDISLDDFQGMKYKIRFNVKSVPDEAAIINVCNAIWEDGNKNWEEFYIYVYLSDMSIDEQAYCVLAYSNNGYEDITYLSIDQKEQGYIMITIDSVKIKVAPSPSSSTVAIGMKNDIFELDKIENNWFVVFMFSGDYRYINKTHAIQIDSIPPYSFPIDIKKKVFKEVYKAEGKSEEEAMSKFPNDLYKELDYTSILDDKYKLIIFRKYSIPAPYAEKLNAEGAIKKWHKEFINN